MKNKFLKYIFVFFVVFLSFDISVKADTTYTCKYRVNLEDVTPNEFDVVLEFIKDDYDYNNFAKVLINGKEYDFDNPTYNPSDFDLVINASGSRSITFSKSTAESLYNDLVSNDYSCPETSIKVNRETGRANYYNISFASKTEINNPREYIQLTNVDRQVQELTTSNELVESLKNGGFSCEYDIGTKFQQNGIGNDINITVPVRIYFSNGTAKIYVNEREFKNSLGLSSFMLPNIYYGASGDYTGKFNLAYISNYESVAKSYYDAAVRGNSISCPALHYHKAYNINNGVNTLYIDSAKDSTDSVSAKNTPVIENVNLDCNYGEVVLRGSGNNVQVENAELRLKISNGTAQLYINNKKVEADKTMLSDYVTIYDRDFHLGFAWDDGFSKLIRELYNKTIAGGSRCPVININLDLGNHSSDLDIATFNAYTEEEASQGGISGELFSPRPEESNVCYNSFKANDNFKSLKRDLQIKFYKSSENGTIKNMVEVRYGNRIAENEFGTSIGIFEYNNDYGNRIPLFSGYFNGNVTLILEANQLQNFFPEDGTCRKVYLGVDGNETFDTWNYHVSGDQNSLKDAYGEVYTAVDKSISSINEEEEKASKNPMKRLGTCAKILGSASEDGTVAHILNIIYNIMKIVAIIWAIVMTMIDLTQEVFNNKEKLTPTLTKIAKRLVMLVIIFFLPTIIDIIGNIIGIDDVLCGIK